MAINPLIVELLKWGISAGADIAKARAALRANGVDPDEYKAVIDDKRTFRDFHRENPRNQPPEVPAPAPCQYFTILGQRPDRSALQVGDKVHRSNVTGKWIVTRPGLGFTLTPDFELVETVGE